MQTIKSAVVVVLLMVILYGAFVAMNGQETELPADLENMISENLMTAGPDFSMDAGTSTQLAQSDAASPAASSAAPADSPFAFWPGATPASPATIPEPLPESAVASPEPLASTPPLLAPPPTIDAQAEALAVAPPEMPKPVAEKADEQTAAAITPVAKSAAATDAGPATLAPPPAGDPWLKTLQSSVGSVDATAAAPAASAASASPALGSASDSRADFSVNSQSYDNAKRMAMDQIDAGKLKDALRTLSVFYGSPELTSQQRADLLDLLDALASEVIYSRRHLVDLPYIVAPDETLEDIAAVHEVPLELLARINGIADVKDVKPGTKLKVVRGPFRGEVDVTTREMTMFLDELYAGRFPVSTGQDPEPREGVFQVVDKQEQRTYYGPGGLQIDGSDPRNPYGGLWLDLGQQISIHGSPVNPAADTKQLGCISLSPIDAKDVFMMLGRGSQVTIKR